MNPSPSHVLMHTASRPTLKTVSGSCANAYCWQACMKTVAKSCAECILLAGLHGKLVTRVKWKYLMSLFGCGGTAFSDLGVH